MKVLVTGANGMLGQDLCPVLEDEDFDVVETDINSMDFTNKSLVEKVLTKEMPDFVIHCGAYTNVDGAEDEKETAYKINVEGTGNIVDVCKKLNIGVVYISTDYVFDGTKKGMYVPSDKVNPINEYGRTKLEGEELVKSLEKHYIIRTSWLYGHHGKNFVETMISLKDKPEIKVVDDQIGCPTRTYDLACALCDILLDEEPFGIYHICGSGETSWFGFAKKIFELTGFSVNLLPCKTEEFPRKAKRPHNSRMANEGRCRNWETALKEYIELRCE